MFEKNSQYPLPAMYLNLKMMMMMKETAKNNFCTLLMSSWNDQYKDYSNISPVQLHDLGCSKKLTVQTFDEAAIMAVHVSALQIP